jgi:hypothetical protein
MQTFDIGGRLFVTTDGGQDASPNLFFVVS